MLFLLIENQGLILFVLFLSLIVGIISLIKPTAIIRFQHFGMFKNKMEPTDFAIITTRISGVILIIGSIFLIIFTLSF